MNTYPPMFLAGLKFKTVEANTEGWSVNVSAGFTCDDIESVTGIDENKSIIRYAGHTQTFKLSQLNRRS